MFLSTSCPIVQMVNRDKGVYGGLCFGFNEILQGGGLGQSSSIESCTSFASNWYQSREGQ